ncbi:hypothetical protein [Streptomyces naphthomycinicus]|uniref:hypothetical protein n=1 Tax=Streptomyces naphthomycinicus TaxID=2872625 RepID=UPI001CECD4E9|nr:hypothetical protein [Streptomyces sp. TML10]
MRKFLGPLPRTSAGTLAFATLSPRTGARSGTPPRHGTASRPCAPHGPWHDTPVTRTHPETRSIPLARGAPVAHGGDRGGADDRRTLIPGPRRTPGVPSGSVTPPDDVPLSTISDPGDVPVWRVTAYADTPAHCSDVSDLGPALRRGGDQPGLRLVPHADAARAGTLLLAVDARI